MLHSQLREKHALGADRASVGSAIGTTLHATMAQLFRTKLSVGEVFPYHVDEALDQVWDKFLEEEQKSEEGLIWDQTTKDAITAKEQLNWMAQAFLPIVDRTDPQYIEEEFQWLISPLGEQAIPVMLVGHVDIIDSRGEIHDHKTGKDFPSPHAQLGAYAILARFHEKQVTNVRVNYVPRLGPTKVTEIPSRMRSVRLSLEDCVQSAWNTIKEFQRHYMQWLETNDPYSFPANPVSMMCTEKYCPAWGSSFCRLGKIEG